MKSEKEVLDALNVLKTYVKKMTDVAANVCLETEKDIVEFLQIVGATAMIN